ncbi:MAG: ABC transporter substrate-binding protein [Candidatus Methanomethylophilaceae archaeon]|nr:ABC transporter substrate-binding protein [Candidatus Methanomethylophilaceae archaeon]
MKASNVKLAAAAVIAVAVVASVPFIGFTVDTVDEKQGVMIDYAYYNVEWAELRFEDGMSGMDALESVCGSRGYKLEMNDDGTVYSVNNVPQLLNVSWGMYVLEGQGKDVRWTEVEDPGSFDVSGQKIISWARTGTGSGMMPAVDATGFTYYSYADRGLNSAGEKLRIVALAPSVAETVAAVGGLQYVIATDRYCDYPHSLVERQRSGDVRIVGGFTDPNFELIAAESPDLVFMDGGTGEHVTMADKLRKAGINCVVLNATNNTDDLLKNLWICASALGFSEVGNAYIKDVNEAINNICRVADLSGKKVFVSLGVSESPYTAGGNTYVTNMIESLGAVNVFSTESESWFMVDKEAVYDRQPDVIVIIYELSEIKSQREYRTVLASLNDMWKETPAYRNGEVYVFSADAASLLSRPGARLPESLELLAKIMDPDSFEAADPTDTVGVKYYGNSYNDGDNGYLTYVKAQGLLEWQRD